jgi:hypothetical protein
LPELLSLPTAGRYSPPRLSPQKRKEKTLEALLAQVTALAERKPMFLLFEDVHWIDPSSLEWLSLAVKRASAHKILLVVTARPEFTMPWPNEAHVATLAADFPPYAAPPRGPAAYYVPPTKPSRSSRRSPLSSTVLVSSSRNSGTPSVRETIWFTSSSGSALLPATFWASADGPDSRLTRLRLQIAKGNALIAAQGHHAHATTAAFARARELAAQLDDPPERFSAYYGVWVGSVTRAELAQAQETAEAFLKDAARRPGSPEAGIAHRSYSMTRWFQGDFVGARQHGEQVLTIYDRDRDRELAFKFGQDYGITAMSFLALVLWPLGELDRARRLADEAVAQALQMGHVPTLYLVRNVPRNDTWRQWPRDAAFGSQL